MMLSDTVCFLVVFLVGILIFVAVTGVLSYTVYIAYVRRKYAHIPGPKPSSFFLGNLQEVRKGLENGKFLHMLITEWAREYGPIFKFSLAHVTFIIVLDAVCLKHLIVTVNCPKGKRPYGRLHTLYGERFMGGGLVSERCHDRWARRRALINPAFNRSSLKLSVEQFNASVDLLIDELKKKADGKTSVTMLEEFQRLTIDVIGKVAFGIDCNMIAQTKNPFLDANEMVLTGITRASQKPFDDFNPWSREFRRKVRESVRLHRETGRAAVEKRIDEQLRGEVVNKDDLLELLIKGSDNLQGNKSQMEEILDDFVTFYIAGQETTANLIALTLMELIRHPEILERVRLEIKDVLGGRTNVEFEDVAKLAYTSQVVKETLRMWPPTPAVMRMIEKDEILSGIRVPSNSLLMVNIFALARQEEYFEDALTFNPDRFSDASKIQSHAHIPFSFGPRNCIGQHFALIETKVTLCKLLQVFDFSWAPSQSYDVINVGTLKPKDGCQNYITLRKK